jgi:RNA polymerase sigma-70 factor, ECF subfamily
VIGEIVVGTGTARRVPSAVDAGAPTDTGDRTVFHPVARAASAGQSPVRDRDPEDTLVDRLRRGDEVAFSRFVEEHDASLRRIARLYVPDAVADEVVQETWMAVLHGIDRFEGRSAIRTWMVSILLNIARSRGAREQRQIPFSAFADPAATAEPAVDPNRFQGPNGRFPGGWISFPERWDEQPEERYLSAEGVEIARRAIARLPPAQRDVVTLRDVEGWSSDEVSQALGITSGNQRVLLHRGRSRVRAAIETAIAASLGEGRRQ